MTRQVGMEPLVAVTWLLAEYYCEHGTKFARKPVFWDYNTTSLTHLLRFVRVVYLFLKQITYIFFDFIQQGVDLIIFALDIFKVTHDFSDLWLQYLWEV